MLDGADELGATLEVLGRRLRLPHAAGGLLRASFASLCGAALGPQDYLAVAERFHTVFLEDVPILEPAKRDAARRFVTLIDVLYEADAKLVVLAAAEPDALYPTGDGAFEFERTASRLHEMRSEAWLEKDR
jgi:cell division protein ZapE